MTAKTSNLSASQIQQGKAASASLSLMGSYMSYRNYVVNADAQIAAIDLSISENRNRHFKQVKNLRRSAQKLKSQQTEQFLASGVKLEGSALDVLSDTFYDELEAVLDMDNQLAFQEEQQRVQQASIQASKKAAKTNFLLNSAGTIMGSKFGG